MNRSKQFRISLVKNKFIFKLRRRRRCLPFVTDVHTKFVSFYSYSCNEAVNLKIESHKSMLPHLSHNVFRVYSSALIVKTKD